MIIRRFKRILKRILKRKTDSKLKDFSAISLTEFWKKDSMKNIVPPGTTEPEGWDVKSFLAGLDTFKEASSVAEIGCGPGRLSAAFSPEKYIGVDINPEAISTAQKKNSKHSYRVIGYEESYPEAEVGLAYTVFLHVPDDLIDGVISRASSSYKKFVIAEILGRKWRSPTQRVPVFNREQQEYVELFSKYGMSLEKVFEKKYVHYKDTNISFLVFSK